MLVLFRRRPVHQSCSTFVSDVLSCLVKLELDGYGISFDLSRHRLDQDSAGERLVAHGYTVDDQWIELIQPHLLHHGLVIASVKSEPGPGFTASTPGH